MNDAISQEWKEQEVRLTTFDKVRDKALKDQTTLARQAALAPWAEKLMAVPGNLDEETFLKKDSYFGLRRRDEVVVPMACLLLKKVATPQEALTILHNAFLPAHLLVIYSLLKRPYGEFAAELKNFRAAERWEWLLENVVTIQQDIREVINKQVPNHFYDAFQQLLASEREKTETITSITRILTPLQNITEYVLSGSQ